MIESIWGSRRRNLKVEIWIGFEGRKVKKGEEVEMKKILTNCRKMKMRNLKIGSSTTVTDPNTQFFLKEYSIKLR